MTLAAVSLDDKYAAWSGEVYMTGTQALVRLPMMQHLRDKAAGLDTACLISGYRGSPLGNFDRSLWQARRFLEAHGVLFKPGVNEGPGRHRPLGHPAGGPLPRREARRRLRHLVRQGAGRGPHHGRVQARQQRRHRAPWRRARAGRRRPRLRLLDHGAPERVRLHERRHAGAQPGRRAGVPGLRAARLGALAPCRALGGLHLHRRDGGQRGDRLGGPPTGRHRCPRRGRAAAGRAQHPLARHAARPGGAPARAQARRRARLRPGEQARPRRHRRAGAPPRHRHHRKILSRRAPRRSTISASTRRQRGAWAWPSTRSA